MTVEKVFKLKNLLQTQSTSLSFITIPLAFAPEKV